MHVTIPFELLLDYSDHERRKWREWLRADHGRLCIPLQPGGRFQTVADLLEHVFFVERRHLSRLNGAALPEATGLPPGDVDALFEYAERARADLRRTLADLDAAGADEPMVLPLSIGDVPTTRRQLAAHIVLHEIRHLAQIALAARLAGQTPPGAHDLLFFGTSIEEA